MKQYFHRDLHRIQVDFVSILDIHFLILYRTFLYDVVVREAIATNWVNKKTLALRVSPTNLSPCHYVFSFSFFKFIINNQQEQKSQHKRFPFFTTSPTCTHNVQIQRYNQFWFFFFDSYLVDSDVISHTRNPKMTQIASLSFLKLLLLNGPCVCVNTMQWDSLNPYNDGYTHLRINRIVERNWKRHRTKQKSPFQSTEISLHLRK